MAGQTVTFTATVNEVRAIKLAKLDDTFAKRAAQLETLDALKEDIKQNLLLGKEEDSRKVYETAVLDAVIKASKLEVSEMLEHEQAHELEHDFEKQIESSGMKLDDWLKVQKKDAKDFHQELHVEARRRISIGLIIRDIIEKQKFNVTTAEVEEALAKMRENYSDPQIIKELDDPKFKNDLANRLVTQKAVDWLCHNAKNDVKEKSKKTTKK